MPKLLSIFAFFLLSQLGWADNTPPECQGFSNISSPLSGINLFQRLQLGRIVVLPSEQGGSTLQGILEPDIWYKRHELIQSVEHSLEYLDSPAAERDYGNLAHGSLALDLVVRSMRRFYDILRLSNSPRELRCSLLNEFRVFRSVGQDGKGTVRFTGYFQPVYKASRVRTSLYQFPIYRPPPELENWNKPHPSRQSLEGYDGRGNSDGRMRGLELAWLPSRYEAFMIQVQGSAILELPDGSRMAVGYGGGLGHPFVGFGRDMYRKYNIKNSDLKQFFIKNPDVLNEYLTRNNRMVFFNEKPSDLPIGSLGVPVVAERSIATDKTQLPPGALALIQTTLPTTGLTGDIRTHPGSRLVVDHDTGSGIKGPGRVDVFMGTGDEAQKKAVSLYSTGELYYLVLAR